MHDVYKPFIFRNTSLLQAAVDLSALACSAVSLLLNARFDPAKSFFHALARILVAFQIASTGIKVLF